MTRRTWLLFAVFCILSSIDWLLPLTPPDAPAALLQQCILFALVGLAALGFLVFTGRLRELTPWRSTFPLAVCSIALLSVPLILLSQASDHLPDVTIAAIFAFVPAIVVLMLAQGEDGAYGLVMPAILGVAGLLFVLPLDIPGSLEGRLSLTAALVAALLVAVASARIYRLLQRISFLHAAVPIFLTNAVVLLIACVATGQSHLQRTALTSQFSLANATHTVVLILLLVLLWEMPPARLAARYLVIPLLTVIEGFALIRPTLTWQTGFGIVLALTGAGWLLRGAGTAEGSSLSLRT